MQVILLDYDVSFACVCYYPLQVKLLIAMTARLTSSNNQSQFRWLSFCSLNKLKYVAAATENMQQSFGDITQPQH